MYTSFEVPRITVGPQFRTHFDVVWLEAKLMVFYDVLRCFKSNARTGEGEASHRGSREAPA